LLLQALEMPAQQLWRGRMLASPAMLPMQDLKFGRTFTDHLLIAEHVDGAGWGRPQIRPFSQGITVHPAATVLHYGMCCFEGMKAYHGADGRGRLFRCLLRLHLRPQPGVPSLSLDKASRGTGTMHAWILTGSFGCRPEMNMARLNRSSQRLMLAGFDPGMQALFELPLICMYACFPVCW
jgi:hypothetical protein